jgi:4'-phosphopantetheinyl transferase EntD
MPLFYQHNINPGTKLGIWHIAEPESFFLEKVPLKKDVSHPFKRLQHLAGRWLLPLLFDDFPLEEILIADTRKPFLESERYHFSISHCGQFAAAIVSTTNRVGVDIESIRPRIGALSHKFMNEREAMLLQQGVLPEQKASGQDGVENRTEYELLTLVWSAKESIFKWYGRGEMDFRRHMQLTARIGQAGDWLHMPFVFDKEDRIDLTIEARIFGEQALTLAWVLT